MDVLQLTDHWHRPIDVFFPFMSSIIGNEYMWKDGGGGVMIIIKTIVWLVMHLCKQLSTENTKTFSHKIKNNKKVSDFYCKYM